MSLLYCRVLKQLDEVIAVSIFTWASSVTFGHDVIIRSCNFSLFLLSRNMSHEIKTDSNLIAFYFALTSLPSKKPVLFIFSEFDDKYIMIPKPNTFIPHCNISEECTSTLLNQWRLKELWRWRGSTWCQAGVPNKVDSECWFWMDRWGWREEPLHHFSWSYYYATVKQVSLFLLWHE